MLLLDTEAVPAAQRVEAFHHAMTHASVPKRIEHDDSPLGLRARMEAWQLDGLTLFTSSSTGFRLTRTERHVRQETRPLVALSLQNAGVGRAEADGARRLIGPDDVYLCNEMAPHHYGWSREGAAQTLLVDVDRLGVPVDSVGRAASRLRASPMHALVHQHLRDLWKDPGAIEADPAAPAVARATVELVRALLISAAEDARSPLSRAAMDDTLLTRLRTDALQRLSDPDLDAETLARRHGVSVRRLYGVFARAGIGLEQWIIAERLERARADLASAHLTALTVAAVSRRWGFRRPSHFGRRFRERYGVTPGEWRRQARAEQAPGRE